LWVSGRPKQHRRVRRSVLNSARRRVPGGVHLSSSFWPERCLPETPRRRQPACLPACLHIFFTGATKRLGRSRIHIGPSPKVPTRAAQEEVLRALLSTPHTSPSPLLTRSAACRRLSHHRYVDPGIGAWPPRRPASACSWPHRSPPIRAASVRARRFLTGATAASRLLSRCSPDADWVSVLVLHPH
jgi:hypothetical protein